MTLNPDRRLAQHVEGQRGDPGDAGGRGHQGRDQADGSAAWSATRKEGKLGSYFSSWSADYNDPDNFIYTFFAPQNSAARSWNYENKEVQDQIWRRLERMTDMAARYKLYQDIENQIVNKDFAFVPMFHLNHLFVVQPKVKNFTIFVERLEQHAVLRYRDNAVRPLRPDRVRSLRRRLTVSAAHTLPFPMSLRRGESERQRCTKLATGFESSQILHVTYRSLYMLRYILGRLAQFVPVIIATTFLTFLLLEVVPGDPIAMMMKEHIDADVVARVRKEMRLDDPWPVRYVRYMGGVLHGDFGESYKIHRSVSELLKNAFPPTLALTVSRAAGRLGDRHTRRNHLCHPAVFDC